MLKLEFSLLFTLCACNSLMWDTEWVMKRVAPAPVHLQAFSVVFQKAVLKAEPDEALKQRVSNLIDSITSSVFQYTTRGLFECDKLTYIAQLAFQVGKRKPRVYIFCMVCFLRTSSRYRIESSSWDHRLCSDLIKQKGNALCETPSCFVVPPDPADE